MTYIPSQEILDKYADVMVNFAANEGRGVKPGQVVYLSVPEEAKPFLVALHKKVLEAGAHPIARLHPSGLTRTFFELATDEQLTHFPRSAIKGLVDSVDVMISVIADDNPKELEGIDSKKIMKSSESKKEIRQWWDEKEVQGNFSWTLAMYGTQAMADEAGLTLEEYWDEIINACHLDAENPLALWKDFQKQITELKTTLNNLDIDKIYVKAPGTDLTIGLGEHRKWLGMSGHNIPSFEVFVSPDWRETRGHITFTEKLYRYGNLIENVYLEFDEEGCVKKATASKGEAVLKEMIAQENANKVGEFSLTDKRFSKITKFMAQTLFDENVGGANGNTHIALGNAYKDSYTGDVTEPTKEKWAQLGFNESNVHTDIVATSPREVTVKTKDGKQLRIYKDGMFVI